jgi:hypothetical protein
LGKERLRRKAVEQILKREGEVGLEILAWGGGGGGAGILSKTCLPPLFNSQSFSISVMTIRRRGVLEIFWFFSSLNFAQRQGNQFRAR